MISVAPPPMDPTTALFLRSLMQSMAQTQQAATQGNPFTGFLPQSSAAGGVSGAPGGAGGGPTGPMTSSPITPSTGTSFLQGIGSNINSYLAASTGGAIGAQKVNQDFTPGTGTIYGQGMPGVGTGWVGK